MKKHNEVIARLRATNKNHRKTRQFAMYCLSEIGFTYQEIGDMFGLLSRQRAHQIVSKYKRKILLEVNGERD